MAADAKLICKTYEDRVMARANWDALVDEVYEFHVPRKRVLTINARTPGDKRTLRLFDGTGGQAAKLLTATMQGSLTSDALRWFSLEMRDSDLHNAPGVAEWLEDTADRMYLALNQSNFTGQATEAYLELVTAGTTAMLEEERAQRAPDLDPRFGPVFNGLHFRTLTFGEYAIAEDPLGFVDTLYRCTEFTARQIAMRFGIDTLPEDVRDTWKEKPHQKLEVIHASYPRGEYDQAKANRKNKPWASCYVLKKQQTLLGEGGTDEFPYIVARWATTSGEEYGRSPAMDALPDVRSLNRARELFLRSAAKKIDPPMKARSDGVLGDPDIRPSGITVVEDMDALMPLETGADINWTQFSLSELRTQIREVFFWDQLQLPGGGQQNT